MPRSCLKQDIFFIEYVCLYIFNYSERVAVVVGQAIQFKKLLQWNIHYKIRLV